MHNYILLHLAIQIRKERLRYERTQHPKSILHFGPSH